MKTLREMIELCEDDVDDIMPHDENLIKTIKERAKLFVTDNFTNPSKSDLLIIEQAMLIGASIAIENDAEELSDRGWELEAARIARDEQPRENW